MASKKPVKNTEQFVASPAIIYSLIRAQAGTLAKAVLECVMNSIDAGADTVSITLTGKTLKVVDNGKGFATRDEIETCFKVFGFEHHEGDRLYGQFGIGRAQLWNFCSTVWRTHQFEMDVDIKRRGLDYDISDSMPDLPGLVISGKFYEPMLASDMHSFERELTDLCIYAPANVTLNGKRISKDPTTEKWTHETDDAWVRLKEGSDLVVYNMGVKVRAYSSYNFGVGGVVVTKPKVRLALNMARNDILQSECQVWKRIKPFLQGKADERMRTKKTQLSEEELQNLCLRFITGELDFKDIEDRKVLQAVDGRSVSISGLLNSRDRSPIVVSGSREDRRALKIHESHDAFVASALTLDRFGCETIVELGEKLAALHAQGRMPSYQDPSRLKWMTLEEGDSLLSSVHDDYEEIPWAKHTKDEKALCLALQTAATGHLVPLLTRGLDYGERYRRTRSIVLGNSETALAWTNAVDRITLSRDHALKMARSGFPGFMSLAHLILHEYLHDVRSQGSHVHDHAFYERFEDVTTNQRDSFAFGQFTVAAYQQYIRRCKSAGVTITKAKLTGADLMDADELVPTSADELDDTPVVIEPPARAVVQPAEVEEEPQLVAHFLSM